MPGHALIPWWLIIATRVAIGDHLAIQLWRTQFLLECIVPGYIRHPSYGLSLGPLVGRGFRGSSALPVGTVRHTQPNLAVASTHPRFRVSTHPRFHASTPVIPELEIHVFAN